jgi:cytochrome c oxidase assembly protein subunit 15
MTTDSADGTTSIIRRHRYLLLTASVLTYLLITMGGTVCVTGSGLGCPDWPGCYGQIIPPMRIDAIIEYLHRFIAALTSPFIIAAAIVGWWKLRSIRWVSRPPVIAIVFLVAVSVFGALAVLRGLSPGLAAVDLGSALMVLTLMLTATVMSFYHYDHPALPDRLSLRSPFARLSIGTLAMVFIVLVSGVLVADAGSIVRCLGWSLYGGGWVPVDSHDWFQMARRLVAGLASILAVAVVVQAWRTQRTQAALLAAATVMGILFLVETTVGALMAMRGFSVTLLVIYVATAAAVWASLVVLVVLAGLVSLTPAEERLTVAPPTASAV